MTDLLKSMLGKKDSLVKDMRSIITLAEKEDRGLTEQEEKNYGELEQRLDSLAGKIARERRLIEEQRQAAPVDTPQDDPLNQDDPDQPEKRNRKPAAGRGKDNRAEINKRYSLTKALRSHVKGQPLTGLEKEMQQEAEKEMRQAGITANANALHLPSLLMEKRATLQATTAGTGGNTVATELGDVIGVLRPRLRVEELGATMLTGLTGNIAFPNQATAATAAWASENAAATETNPTFGLTTLSPNRLTAKTHVSGQLLLQSSADIDGLLQRDLSTAIALAVDAAAINGSGANTPTGILGTSGVGDTTIGAAGGALTRALLLEMIGKIEDNNADQDTLAWLTTPGVRRHLMNINVDSGSGRFLWSEETPNELMGYRAATSTQVPSDLEKGGSGTILHAAIFANWREWVVASWGGVSITSDQYTLADENIIRLIVHSWWDMMARHAASFSICDEIDIS